MHYALFQASAAKMITTLLWDITQLNFRSVIPAVYLRTKQTNTYRYGSQKYNCIYVIHKVLVYTGCPRRNVPDFGRVFVMLNYTDITQNTYVQSRTVTEIMAREKCGLLAGPRTVPVS